LRTEALEAQSEAQRKVIALLEEKLDLNQSQVRAALEILGEANVPREQLTAKLVEIAERIRDIEATVFVEASDNPKTTALRIEARRAVEEGELGKADALLANIQIEQSPALIAAAETSAQRGEIAMARLRYDEAAKHFANAATLIPLNSAHEDKRIAYLELEANALYRQGDEFGDNKALRSAIDRCRHLIELFPREHDPLLWAAAQNTLGIALVTLGRRESRPARLEEAVAAFRAALKEYTRERVPLRLGGGADESGQCAHEARGTGERD